MIIKKAYYIVLRNGSNLITKHHETYEDATSEAERLARKERDKFTVYMAVSEFEVDEIPVRQTKFNVMDEY